MNNGPESNEERLGRFRDQLWATDDIATEAWLLREVRRLETIVEQEHRNRQMHSRWAEQRREEIANAPVGGVQ